MTDFVPNPEKDLQIYQIAAGAIQHNADRLRQEIVILDDLYTYATDAISAKLGMCEEPTVVEDGSCLRPGDEGAGSQDGY